MGKNKKNRNALKNATNAFKKCDIIYVCNYCGQPKVDFDFSLIPIEDFIEKCIRSNVPCDKCKQIMDKGIMFMSASDESMRKDPNKPYRTGRMVALELENAYQIFPKLREMPNCRCTFMPDSAFNHFFSDAFPDLNKSKCAGCDDKTCKDHSDDHADYICENAEITENLKKE